jgi:hypothetical protein
MENGKAIKYKFFSFGKSFTKKKIMPKDIFEYFLVSFLIILSARASFISDNRLFTILFFLLNLGYFIYSRKKLGKFSLLLAYYIFWIILIFIFFNLSILSYRNIYTYGGFLIIVLSSFFIVSTVENIFYKLINIIYYLALISLALYIIQLIIPQQFFKINNILSNVPFFIRQNINPDIYSNSIFFTFQRGVHINRNSGFAWEPGAFGCFLIISLFIYLTINKFRLGIKFWILLIAAITTFSTTTYFGILFIFFFILYNSKNMFKSFWIFIIIIILIFSFLNISFLREKIINQITETVKTIQSDSYIGKLNRFESFFYDLKLLKENLFFLFLGRGIQAETRFISGDLVHLSSGIGDYLLMFGIIGLSLLVFNIFNSIKKLTFYNKSKGYILFFVAIILTLFSNPMVYTPLIFMFQYYYLTKQKCN